MGFDYSHTCPQIDRAISQAKSSLESQIDDLLSDACPLLSRAGREEEAKRRADGFYDAIEDAFETVRSTNEDMRKEAERQISSLEDEIAGLRSQVEQLEREAA